MDIHIKRIYEMPTSSDEIRILVDRIWPRGINKKDAKLSDWCKEIAPSHTLRKWFDHREDRFEEFSEKYKKELQSHSDILEKLIKKYEHKKLTLLYGAKDEKHNQAVVLKKFIEEQYSS